MRWKLVMSAMVLTAATPLNARQADDADEVVSAVDAFHAALAAGDSAAALQLLASDAIGVESGGVQSRAEYRSEHLGADMEFAASVSREHSEIRVRRVGDVAWAWSTATATGTFRGRDVNTRSAELMVLARTSEGWRIRAIHWSSRPRRQ